MRAELYKLLLPSYKTVREKRSEKRTETRRPSTLKETVDNLLRMQRMVAYAG